MRSVFVSFVLVSVLGASLAVGQAAASGDSGGWTPTPTPNPTTATGYLNAVSCGGIGQCVAVGYYSDSAGDVVPLAEVSAGTGWILAPPVIPAGAGLSVLNAISCATASSCEAVGFWNDAASKVHTFAELYSNGEWTLQATPGPAGAHDTGLLGIECRSAADCIAVGSYNDTFGASKVLGERWNGTTWTPQYVPSPGEAVASQLDAVSCTASDCAAVGSYRTSDGLNIPLTETLGASGWQIQLTNVPDTNVAANLQGVSCDSSGVCIAVGYWTDDMGNGYALTEQRVTSTAAWTILPAPPVGAAQNGMLSAVSCQTATDCTAAGSASIGTLIEHWNGKHWTRQASGAVSRSGATGVSCASASSCLAVGYVLSTAKIPVPLVDSYDGVGWHVAAGVPAPDGAVTADLSAVSCSSAGLCTAVGEQTAASGRTSTAIVDRFEAGVWTAQPAANPAHAIATALDGVSCADDTHCLAAGYDFAHGTSASVVESWDGTTWTLGQVPAVAGSTSSDLRAVSCASITSCMAVGEYSDATGNTSGLAVQLAGGQWQLRPMPLPPGTAYSTLTGVSCVASRCTVVGNRGTAHGKPIVIIEVWDGTSWAIQHAAIPPDSAGVQLEAVSCPSASTCTAVGSYIGGDQGIQFSLAERHSGAGWTVQSTQNPDNVVANPLQAVSCAGIASCTAGGYSYGLNPAGLPAPPNASAQAWDGGAWSLQSVAVPPGTNSSTLAGLSCTGGVCVGVGYRFASSGRQVTFAATNP